MRVRHARTGRRRAAARPTSSRPLTSTNGGQAWWRAASSRIARLVYPIGRNATVRRRTFAPERVGGRVPQAASRRPLTELYGSGPPASATTTPTAPAPTQHLDDAAARDEQRDRGGGEQAELPALAERARERERRAGDRADRRRPGAVEERACRPARRAAGRSAARRPARTRTRARRRRARRARRRGRRAPRSRPRRPSRRPGRGSPGRARRRSGTARSTSSGRCGRRRSASAG